MSTRGIPYERVFETYNSDNITLKCRLWTTEVTESRHGCEAGTIQQVAVIVQTPDVDTNSPNLVYAFSEKSKKDSGTAKVRTFWPATIHRASRSTAPESRRAFSRSRARFCSSSV